MRGGRKKSAGVAESSAAAFQDANPGRRCFRRRLYAAPFRQSVSSVTLQIHPSASRVSSVVVVALNIPAASCAAP